ncbi:hypothetical protein TRIUR3_09789 [Triticum urartu]|uniref:Uncharacterized protein n=1 Tax=Triticum urartu TaxID=4572 RepID=M8ADM1_TRIUA|nr:hypothetical protein TRIUR3_09789 [Triticum urartu]
MASGSMFPAGPERGARAESIRRADELEALGCHGCSCHDEERGGGVLEDELGVGRRQEDGAAVHGGAARTGALGQGGKKASGEVELDRGGGAGWLGAEKQGERRKTRAVVGKDLDRGEVVGWRILDRERSQGRGWRRQRRMDVTSL